jgi:hypothetical protein
LLTKILIAYLIAVALVAVWMTRYSVTASANNSWLLDRWTGTLHFCAGRECIQVKGDG